MFSRGREFLGVSCCLGMFEREVGNSGWLPLASFPPNVIKVEIWRDRTLCAPSCSSFSISTNGNKCYVWAMGCTAIRIAGKRMLIPRNMIRRIRKPSFVWFPPIQSPDAPHEWRGVPSRGFQFVTRLCLHAFDDQQWPGALVLCKSAYSILFCTACQELVHFRFVSTARF